jgi:hypothetical protein
MKISGVASVGLAMFLSRSLVECLGCWTRHMLFVAVAEGRLWIVGLDGFDSWWRCNGMVGSMMEAICGSLMDTFAVGGSVGTKASMMMMTRIVVASVLYG